MGSVWIKCLVWIQMRRFHSGKRLACCMNTNKREADHMTDAEEERLQASGKVLRVSSLWVERSLRWSASLSHFGNIFWTYFTCMKCDEICYSQAQYIFIFITFNSVIYLFVIEQAPKHPWYENFTLKIQKLYLYYINI